MFSDQWMEGKKGIVNLEILNGVISNASIETFLYICLKEEMPAESDPVVALIPRMHCISHFLDVARLVEYVGDDQIGKSFIWLTHRRADPGSDHRGMLQRGKSAGGTITLSPHVYHQNAYRVRYVATIRAQGSNSLPRGSKVRE